MFSYCETELLEKLIHRARRARWGLYITSAEAATKHPQGVQNEAEACRKMGQKVKLIEKSSLMTLTRQFIAGYSHTSRIPQTHTQKRLTETRTVQQEKPSPLARLLHL